MIPEITPSEFKTQYLANPAKFELIDVREPSEFSEVRIKGSKLLPMGSLVPRLKEIDWNKDVVFVCRSGSRSGQVASALKNAGYGGKSLAGGIHILSMNCQECLESGEMGKNYFE
jgi:rhodanese-related sulfurtransferase